MTNAVTNSASEISTAFGGVCCRPSAERRKASTTTMRVNEVTMTRIEGRQAQHRDQQHQPDQLAGHRAARAEIDAQALRQHRRREQPESERLGAAANDGAQEAHAELGRRRGRRLRAGLRRRPSAISRLPSWPSSSRCSRRVAAHQHQLAPRIDRQDFDHGQPPRDAADLAPGRRELRGRARRPARSGRGRTPARRGSGGSRSGPKPSRAAC